MTKVVWLRMTCSGVFRIANGKQSMRMVEEEGVEKQKRDWGQELFLACDCEIW